MNVANKIAKDVKGQMKTTGLNQDYIGCVRLAALGLPRCVAVFFPQDERGELSAHVRPGKKKTHTTGVDPGKLNKRTH